MALRHSLKEARSFFPLQTGFTIVELLIVVVVIAILAALVIVSYNGIQQRAHDASAQTSARQAATKILAYATEHSDMYPDSLAAIAIADSDQISYHYTVDNAAVPRTFCIEAKVTNHTYYVSHEVTQPTAGSCAVVNHDPVSLFGASYPYPINLYTDGNGFLKLATIFYSPDTTFSLKGSRVYLPSIPSGSSTLTLFYIPGWFVSGAPNLPVWDDIPSGIPGQFATLSHSELKVGWNEVLFPTPATITPYQVGTPGSYAWVGYYFSDGNTYVHSTSPGPSSITTANNPHIVIAEQPLQGVSRSSNSLPAPLGTSDALYGIDILTTQP